ncbi:MAG TPA: tetratricopeptide repeat protein [Azospirillaceae bacterium]|nr:tetratricopeptide repeat protein [Azospirillaceae bacterium]
MNRKLRKAQEKLQRKPDAGITPAQVFERALEHHRAGRLAEAEPLYRRVLQAAPQHPPSNTNLAIILRQTGRITEAIPLYQTALLTNPGLPDAWYNLGIALRHAGRLEESAAAYRKAIDLAPDSAPPYGNLGDALKTLGRIPEAIAVLNKGLSLDPNNVEAAYNLGVCLNEEGRIEEARAAFTHVLSVRPGFFPARLSLCIGHLPIIYRDDAEIDRCRAAYRADLEDLAARLRLDTPEAVAAASDAVGLIQPYYLAYQGRNDRDLQRLYGTVICRIMAARYPQWSRRPPMPPRAAGEKLRLGILSGYFQHHSIWKIPLRGWMEHFDRSQFELFSYYTDHGRDEHTDEAERWSARFVQGPSLSVEEWCHRIREDRLHALIVPEIGMDPMAVKLAALWLAPIQIAFGGHPETTGMPTFDHHLTSDLMEPMDGQDHYTETLVRLPNMAVSYKPITPKPVQLGRQDIGIRPDAVMYWSCQSLFKYLPKYDDVFPLIARRVPGAQFAFIRYSKGESVNRVFQERLAGAFARHGLSMADHCVFLPHLTYDQFNAVAGLADVFLDNIGWSGNNTAMESLAYGLPIVTCPTDLMRGRHCAAILSMIGVTDTIARTVGEYVEMAARLGLDPAWRSGIREKIAANRHRAYDDPTCVRELETFLKAAVARH